MATFLLKTEPTDYSFADLVRDKRCEWTGVSNPGALAQLRKARKGDDVLVYHTGDERAIVGLARVERAPYEDPQHPGLNSAGEIKRPVIDIRPVRAAKSPVALATIKADPRFVSFALVRQGRLSVMEVPADIDRALRRMAGLA